ncbi:TetR/AcrR family transcriptional regulator [Microbulbifer litoralis]|uniref:TetR/AcrR family transcriptional regulator n=1 Tax=Microbulbifer litoralis TaxID=2933965 RepID=UPI002027BE1F|nr:TetR/AcrR family transcriptional regulator [Microbulbifer sp. GX H0434]
MTEKSPSLREQQKAATRNELIRMGLLLFFENGFANTTVDQIVEPLGIAKRTFFRYFKAKEDLVFDFYEDKTPTLVRELKNRPKDESPYEAVCKALSTQLDLYDVNPDWAWSLVCLLNENPELMGKGFEKRLTREQALAAALIEREGKNKITPLKARIIVGTALIAWQAALDEWYEGGGKSKLRPIVKKAFSIAGQ